MSAVKVELERQPEFRDDGTRKPELPILKWPVVPRVGDDVDLQIGETDESINGTVHSVIWFSPTWVRIVVRE